LIRLHYADAELGEIIDVIIGAAYDLHQRIAEAPGVLVV